MIIQKFEQEVEKNPNRIAIKTLDNEITYKALNNYANVLAKEITNNYNTINSEKKIAALLFEHGKDMIIGTIGALKAQTIYVPLDPSYPIRRLIYMLQNSEADFIVTNDKNLELARCLIKEAKVDICIINVDQIDIECSTESISRKVCTDDIAYILYTSGSTGNPKGIFQTHRNVLHFIQCYKNTLSITNEDRMILFSAFSHDASIMDIYGALLNGATLYPLNIKSQVGIDKIANWLEEEKITIWHSVPTVYRYFINALTGTEKFSTLRFIALGGENVILHDVEMFQRTFTNAKLVNLYGQTESSFNSAKIYSVDSKVRKVMLGEPVQETEILVVNENREEVSPLEVGEIVILSDYVALGYWKDEEKSREVFQHSSEVGRTYWTGDLGKLLADGSIEFVGRKGLQVKIRGYRIEVEEIENNLLKNEDVKETVVLGRKDKDGYDYLCAYIVSDKKLTTSYLSEYLSERVPDYMIPTFFVQLDKMPLTPNGKVDRKALPEPDRRIATVSEHEAPRNEIEEKLSTIWKDVLMVDRVGINDNFFELGGHSLKATVLISKIYKELNVEIPLREIFNSPTIKGISGYIESTEKSIYLSIEKIEEKEYYEVSSAQKRMYLLQQFNLKSIAYNMPRIISVEGILNKDRLEKTFIKLIKRHETLRTSFEAREDKIMQKVNENIDFKLEWFEVDCIKDTDKAVDNIVKDFVRAFDLSKSPMLRVGLIKLEVDKHILMFDIHHIISDGVSMGILIDEFTKVYEGNELEPLRIQYKDYAAWQNCFLKSEEMQKQKEYWVNRFSDEIPVLNMPIDFQRPFMQSFEGHSINFKLNKEITSGLKRISKETGSTMYMVLLSGVNILISKYSGQEDVIVGTPIAGRPHPDLEKVIGMFVNTLAMRNYPDGNMTYEDFLKEVKENALKAYENQDYQFDELVDQLSVPRDISRNPLFDVMFKMQNFDSDYIELKDIAFKGYNQENRIAKVDLEFSASEIEEEILFTLEYSTKLYKKETIGRMVDCCVNIFKAVIIDTQIKLNEIDMLTAEEKYKLLNEFNDNYLDYPRDSTIHQLFEEQVEKTPDNIAVVFEDKKLTYKELNEKANRLARTLRKKGVRDDSIIGIMVERSLDILVGILAILKAGGAYLPIDPAYPKERIRYMLEDSETKILLTQEHLLNELNFNGEILNLQDKNLYSNSIDNLGKTNISTNLAYVIYTSGSTGKPKGVMINHKALNNFVVGVCNKIDLSMYKNILCLTTITFDIFVLETLVPLLKGIKIVMVGESGQTDSFKLNDIIIRNNIEVLQITPSRLQLLMLDESFKTSVKILKTIMVGGESLPINLFKELNNYPNIKVYNMYGPTETTVWSSIGELKGSKSINIGKPISNTHIYIIDNKRNCLQPIGVAGELCISGDGLARGYLNRPELTAEKFVDNPFEADSRMYKTGDLARWLSDGNIEFLGRIDHQVKIRGFRIELGEIENSILHYEGIKEAIIIDREDENGVKYLCAYIVSEKALTVGALRAHLSKNLPEYMIPSYFVKLEKISLTPNGKIDRKALPKPNGIIVTGTEYEGPRNDVEEKLVEIWKKILNVERVGINDNFFELGGHSLKATMLSSKIYSEFNIELPLKVIFNIPTIKDISKCILNKAIFNDYKNYSESQVLTKLNETNTKNIFVFPPTLGYGIVYGEFAKYIENHTVYSFDFIEDEKRITEYVRWITNIQDEGKFILMGHSAGGNLAFEVAKELEKNGYDVSDIILLDSDLRDEKIRVTSENFKVFDEVIENVRLNLNIPFMVEYISENVQKKLEAFVPYWNELVNDGNINANIHFISCSSANIDKDSLDNKLKKANKWDKLTKKRFKVYQGYGEHGEMVDGYFGKLNAKIINKIIN